MVKLKESTFIHSDGTIDTETGLIDLAKKFPAKYVANIRQGIDKVQTIAALHDPEHQLLRQSLGMAEILLDLQTDPDTVVAAMLEPYVQAEHIALDAVTEEFNDTVSKLIVGMQRMKDIHASTTNDEEQRQLNIDKLRKMLLAIIDDVRVVLIKLAEQTWLIRAASRTPTGSCVDLAKDVMTIYAPLASRLGIGQLKWELEDLAFRQLEPDTYKQLAKLLDSRRVDRENYVEEIKETLKQALTQAGLKNFDIMGRAKHIYSIHRKMTRKDVDYTQIYDIIAVRILTRTVEECYAALSCVHSLWQQISHEFDDYISNPKPNGYRSIHTAVVGPNNKNIEVQMRTYHMHEENELGVAAHWKYKEGANTESQFERKIAWLRQVIEWQRDLAQQEAGLKNMDIHTLFDDRVYVFTPAGEIIDLPTGSTPLDFAYNIHSQIGHRCRGAKINGSIVPLTHKLITGECVEILTAKLPHPSRDWLLPHLGYIHTAKARHRILQWFKQQDFTTHVAEGKAILEREFKHHHITAVDMQRVAKKLHYKSAEELQAGLARGDVRPGQIIQAAQALSANTETSHTASATTSIPIQIQETPTEHIQPQGTVQVHGITDVLTSTARCCKPLPGDAVIGYITRGRGISIHRQDCSNLKRMAHRDRLIDVDWGNQRHVKYPVDIVLNAHDRSDLLKDISGLLSIEKVKLLRLNMQPTSQALRIFLSIEITEMSLLQRILDKLQHLPGVMNAQRQ
jgi:GTP pyrophosphokinase